MPTPSSNRRSSALASSMSKFSIPREKPSSPVFRSNRCMLPLYISLSICALGPRTAGPFRLLSIRKCIPLASATSPMIPSSASISRTR